MSSVYEMRRKRNVKKAIQFTVMVTGSSGTGRTTFVNSLCGHSVLNKGHHRSNSDTSSVKFQTYEKPEFDPAKAHIEPGIHIVPYTTEIDEEDGGNRISLTIVDTPGFGDNIDNEKCFEEILKYLESQYDEVLAEESRIRRNPRFRDNRVHVLLYFIEGTGHGLRELDIQLMKRLSLRVNIIPVIGRADSMTPTELAAAKKMTMEDIEYYNIPIYNFPYDPQEDDTETIEENSALRSMLPFAIVTSDEFHTINGESVRARKYPWGIVNVEDFDHSDFVTLRSAILGSHMADLKDLTQEYLYENYRTEKLSKTISDPRESVLLNPEDLANQSYMIKEEQLQREEEKLREIELRVQKEINDKRMELLAREQELREIEARISKEREASIVQDEREILARKIEMQQKEQQIESSSLSEANGSGSIQQYPGSPVSESVSQVSSGVNKEASASTSHPFSHLANE